MKCVFFFFKQKTAYEVRISDWSSDVFSSDLKATGEEAPAKGDLSPAELTMLRNLLHFSEHDADHVAIPRGEIIAVSADASWDERSGERRVGNACVRTCRCRWWQYHSNNN